MPKIMPVVMAGGSGTRLWPLSTKSKPKQFQPLISKRTMLEETLSRVRGDRFTAPAVIGSLRHRTLIEEQLAEGAILLEPFGRDTGPAAISAALLASEQDPDQLVLLLPADHFIADPDGFVAAIVKGVAAAAEGYLVTLGITPSGPETGFGYIKRGEAVADAVYRAARFAEKPDLETATRYLSEGDYSWNAGIFLFRASDLLREAGEHAPDMLAATKAAYDGMKEEGRIRTFGEDSFGAIKGLSVDYAIMEKTRRAAVVSPVQVGWNDIGSWSAVKSFSEGDGKDAVLIDCANSFVKTAPGAPKVTAIGLQGITIIATKDSILIMPEDRAQDVKSVVSELKDSGDEALL